MKNRFIKYLAFVFVAGISYVHPLAGQEGGFNFHGEVTHEEFYPSRAGRPVQPEDSYLKDQENKGGGKSEQQKTTKKAIEPTEAEPKEQEELQHSGTVAESPEENSGSVLSFNFLHYIIHKFKFSDVIGQ